MIRRKWKNDSQKERCFRCAAPINKPLQSDYPIILSSYIRETRKTIDRIQISIRNYDNTLDTVKSMFKKEFVFRSNHFGKGCYLWNYSIGSSTVTLKRYNKDRRWLSVIMQDPTPENQGIIRDMLMSLREYVSLTEVEVAYDFYPAETTTVLELFWAFIDRLQLKYSRECNFSFVTSKPDEPPSNTFTYYLGKEGNIHEGSKGVRVYLRPIGSKKPEYVRVEPQFNHEWLHKRKIKLQNLPIDPSIVTFSDYLQLREGMSKEWLTKLRNFVFKLRLKKSKHLKTHREKTKTTNRRFGSAAERVLGSCIHDDFLHAILGESFWHGQPYPVPVAVQMSRYKEIFRKYEKGVGDRPGSKKSKRIVCKLPYDASTICPVID